MGGQDVPLDSVHSVYARPLEIPSHQWDPSARTHARLLHEQLFEWLDVAPALVVNRPRTMQANGSKPLQIQLIGEAGFLVPETLVTSNEAEAREFWQRHERVVYKSVSGVRSIVQELDEHAATRLGQVGLLPVQFQEFVPGVDIRVHVVGDRAFAAEIVAMRNRLSILGPAGRRGDPDGNRVAAGSRAPMRHAVAPDGVAVVRYRFTATAGRQSTSAWRSIRCRRTVTSRRTRVCRSAARWQIC